MRGKSYSTEYSRKRQSESNEKIYIVTDPNGNVYIITNLLDFCKTNKLHNGNITTCGSKGWRARLDDRHLYTEEEFNMRNIKMHILKGKRTIDD